MKLKQLAQILIVSCGVLALGACSTTKHNTMEAQADEAGEAQAAGIGEGENFGDTGNGGAHRHTALNKNTYYFDFDRSDVREDDKPAILANAERLVESPNKKVRVEGHTDPRGSREYNVALAERRANAVADLMKSKGVASNQVHVISYGAERLAAPGHSEQDYQLDRRAIIDKQTG
ncbi:MAG: OmpA family protein [Gammaproteobacteria bacterium]